MTCFDFHAEVVFLKHRVHVIEVLVDRCCMKTCARFKVISGSATDCAVAVVILANFPWLEVAVRVTRLKGHVK